MAGTDLDKLHSSEREVARWQKAQRQLLAGRHGSALAAYRDLLTRFPGVAQLWFEQGLAAGGDLDFGLADQSFRKAIERAPKDVTLLILMGQHYHRFRQMDRARACFEQAVVADPGSVHARNSLAAWLERERRLPEAWECVEACLAQHPQDGQARYLRAFLLHRQGRNSEAEAAVRDLIKSNPPDPQVRCSARHLLGLVLDEFGQYDEALRWLLEAKALLRQMADTARLEQDYDNADRHRRQLLSALKPEALARWRKEGPAGAPPGRLAFLGGHPRSGTTLLEQVLGAHPEIRAFDESEAFVLEVLNPVVPAPAVKGLTMDGLNSIGSVWRGDLSSRYFKSLLREGGEVSSGRVLLDKNPSPTTSLPLWLRVFPGLKVIIALRDPRDVIVSCFFQNLALTTVNVNFLSFERAAKHYSDLMDVWLRMRELGGFEWLETRYEDLVENLEAEGQRVMRFLDLSWHPDQGAFHEIARRKIVFSPTYEGVAKPVYKQAVGRWRNYEAALAPIQERLAPYWQAFGYPV